MGKLRSSIDNVVKTSAVLEKAATTLLESRTKEIDDFMQATDLCRGGAEVMYMYLMEKFKKEGKDISGQADATIKDVFDANLGGMLKEHLANQAKVVKLIAERDKTVAVGEALKGNAAKLRGDLDGIQAVIDKKRKKWLVSSKYKAKLKGYEDSVADLRESLVGLEKSLPGQKYGSLVKPQQWAFAASTTVSEIKQATSAAFSQDLKLTKSEDDEHAKQFRGRGFGKSLATMKSWLGEADAMEAEAT